MLIMTLLMKKIVSLFRLKTLVATCLKMKFFPYLIVSTGELIRKIKEEAVLVYISANR